MLRLINAADSVILETKGAMAGSSMRAGMALHYCPSAF